MFLPMRLLAAAFLCLAALPSAAQPVTFEALAPILASRCTMCHAGSSAAADLRLDSLEGLLKGSRNGAVVRSGEPAASELVRRLNGTAQPRMPMTGPPILSTDEIALFERWIASGLLPGAATAQPSAPTPAGTPPAVPTYADVAPIFARRCAKCHSANGLVGPAPEGYLLNSYAATVSRSDRVRVVPGSPAGSELMRRIRGAARPRMPLDGPPYLSEAEIALIADWITQGARDASGAAADVPAGARVRLHGTLKGDGRLDDLELRRSIGRREEPVAADTYVEVRGRVASDGAIVAERIRRR